MVEPISTETVNGHPIRFFPSPTARYDVPWFAFLDFVAAMRLNDEGQLYILQMMRSGPFRDLTQVVATPTGPAVIARTDVAGGIMDAFQRRERLAPGMRDDFRLATMRALHTLAEGNENAVLGIAMQMLRRAALA